MEQSVPCCEWSRFLRVARACAVTALVLTSAAAQCAVVRVRHDSPGPAQDGTTWNTAYRTVAAGLTAATSGGEVWVARGTYPERITLKAGVSVYGGFAGNETLLSQRSIAANTTTLDGQGAGVIATVPATASNSALDGFSLVNGGGVTGGGVNIAGAGTVRIENNTISNCVTTGRGAGIASGGTGVTIRNNVVSSCRSSGGGAFYQSAGSATVIGNRLVNNTSTGVGGGIYVLAGTTAILENVIWNNTASSTGGGISVSGNSATSRVANNLIRGNRSGNWGGGLYTGLPALRVDNNTVTENDATSEGGGVYIASGAPTLTGNIVAFNRTGIYRSTTVADPALQANCVYGNGGYDFANFNAVPIGSNGNIAADPALVPDTNGLLHIQPTSPCRDAGADAAVVAGDRDIDGQARIQGAHADIGADESDGTVHPVPVIHVSPTGDNSTGLDWAHAKRTVQAGLDALDPWGMGEVWVAAGTYPERITLKNGRSVYGGFAGTETGRLQRSPTGNTVTLDGLNTGGSVVTFPAGVGANTVLERITIVNGNANLTQNPSGGGILVSPDGAPRVRDVAISNSRADTHGGGIYSSQARPVFTRTTVDGCQTVTFGGAVYVNQGELTFTRGRIENSLSGGGFHVQVAEAVITGTVFYNNTGNSSGGLVLNGSTSRTRVADNQFRKNTSLAHGGGIAIGGTDPAAAPRIENNTFVDNRAQGEGGAIHISRGSPPLTNNLVTANASGISITTTTATPVLRHNDVFDNSEYNYKGFASDPTGTNGNISVDPLVVSDVDGILHLTEDSPCRDAGDNAAVQAGDTDIDGAPRIQPAGGTVDIGADEYGDVAGPGVVVRVSTTGSDANDGLDWSRAKATVQAAVDAVAVLGSGEVWVAAGTYPQRVTLKTGVNLYGGFAGAETDRDQRNPATHVTTLDAQLGGSVIVTPAGVLSNTGVDGFTLINGKAANGGGISVATNGYPRIENNVIIGCEADSGGGGIWVSAGGPVIRNNVIRGCRAGTGGGIYLNGGSAVLEGNRIAYNSANTAAGIHAINTALTATRNVILGNSNAPAAGQASALNLANLPAGSRVANNVIRGNSGSASVVRIGAGSVAFQNNTVVYNAADSGPAVRVEQGGSLSLANNIVAFNATGISRDAVSAPALSANDVYGNTVNYAGFLSDPTGTNGNISADPLLVNSLRGIPHLLPGSPCRDAGDNAAVLDGDVDIDGTPRVYPAGGKVDIGADEFDGTLYRSPVLSILQIWGGLSTAVAADLAEYDLVTSGTSAGALSLLDAVRAARMTTGLDQ